MRALLLAVLASTTFACSSSDSSGTDDTGYKDPCAGLGCARQPAKLVVKVHDATGAEVPSPSFTESGNDLGDHCPESSDAGAGLCPSGWIFVFFDFSQATHVIAVTAPGFDTQTLTVTIEGPTSCCGQRPEVDQTVTLTPINAVDAGADAADAADAG